MKDIQNQANALGFRGVYLLKPTPYPKFQARRAEGSLHCNSNHLSDDPMRDYPWANVILLLLFPYRPYPKEVPISGYYPASNRSYHATNTLIKYLEQREIRAERVSLPTRETLLRHGIGIACKNGLTAVPPFGTRFVAQMLGLSVPSDLLQHCLEASYDQPPKVCAENCDRCKTACPVNAISDRGMDCFSCLRADMNGQSMRRNTMDQMPSMLGCEICQFACPYNAKIGTETDIPDAFSFERILQGDVRAAYDLIGKNMKSGGRLEQHALILSARLGRTDLLPFIERLRSDSRSQIAEAAEYAFSVLHNLKE